MTSRDSQSRTRNDSKCFGIGISIFIFLGDFAAWREKNYKSLGNVACLFSWESKVQQCAAEDGDQAVEGPGAFGGGLGWFDDEGGEEQYGREQQQGAADILCDAL